MQQRLNYFTDLVIFESLRRFITTLPGILTKQEITWDGVLSLEQISC